MSYLKFTNGARLPGHWVSGICLSLPPVKDRDEFPMILIGNKADLDHQRQVRAGDSVLGRLWKRSLFLRGQRTALLKSLGGTAPAW